MNNKTFPRTSYPPLNPKEQYEVFKQLSKYLDAYDMMVMESEALYGEEFMYEDEWHQSLLSLDMETVSVEIFHMQEQIRYYTFVN